MSAEQSLYERAKDSVIKFIYLLTQAGKVVAQEEEGAEPDGEEKKVLDHTAGVLAEWIHNSAIGSFAHRGLVNFLHMQIELGSVRFYFFTGRWKHDTGLKWVTELPTEVSSEYKTALHAALMEWAKQLQPLFTDLHVHEQFIQNLNELGLVDDILMNRRVTITAGGDAYQMRVYLHSDPLDPYGERSVEDSDHWKQMLRRYPTR